jgi:hypothetical protein
MELKDLDQVEPIFKEWAAGVVRRHGINSDHVEFHLTMDAAHIMTIIPGHVVKCIFMWPHCKLNLNQLMKDFCRAFHKHKLRRTMEVVPFAIIQANNKWMKSQFSDEAQIIFDLIPKQRIKVSKSETITLTDAQTGETISVTSSGKASRFDGSEFEMWVKLSRQVLRNNPKIEIEENDGQTGT